MIKKSDSYAIENIFKNFYVIPPYQREYAWKKDQWENLFNDVLENENGYFLGSLICINKDDSDIFEVIDGQQRLTTISILKNAILNLIKKRWTPSLDEMDKLSLLNDLNYSIYDKHSDSYKLELSIQNSNNDDYKYLCSYENKLKNDNQIKPLNFGNRRIAKAYNYFFERLNEIDDENNHLFSIDEVFNYLEKLNSSLLVRIDVKDATSAFILFESINNRGIPLTPIDLIKNLIIGNLEKFKKIKPEKTNEKWQSIVNNIDDYNDQIRFLRQFYHAFQSNPQIKLKKYSKATKSNIIKIYEEHIKNESTIEFIFDELIKKSEIYTKFIYPDFIEKEDNDYKYANCLNDLLYLGVAPAYSLLLFLFSEYKHINLTEILNTIEKWFIRRHITDFPATRDLDQIFLDLIKYINENKPDDITNFINNILLTEKYFSNDNRLKEFLNGKVYENYSITRYILIKLENSKRNIREEKIDFWELNQKNNYIWTVEHILPQNPDVKSEWFNSFKKDDIEEYVHKIGNLTLTAYNQNLSNSSFERKCKNENGLKTGRVKINKYIEDKNDWKMNNISERSNILIEEIIKLI